MLHISSFYSFLLSLSSIPSYEYTIVCLFTYLFAGHLVCFQIYAIMNTVSQNIPTQAFLWTYIFIVLGVKLTNHRIGVGLVL